MEIKWIKSILFFKSHYLAMHVLNCPLMGHYHLNSASCYYIIMTNKEMIIKQDMVNFPIKEDVNGARVVFLLGNEREGGCVYRCSFCNVRDLHVSTHKENKANFRKQYDAFKEELGYKNYHALLYNEGNGTNKEELSRETLEYILDTFNEDEKISFLSINSREEQATSDVLDYLADKYLNYPVHFILGQESFSERTPRVLGKNTNGSLERFVEKLRGYNQRDSTNKRKDYTFGLDVNLVFLPELYLDEGESREGNESKIREGIKKDLWQLLQHVNPDVPIEINIHCYSRVDKLSLKSANYGILLQIVPELQGMVEEHNITKQGYETHIFLGYNCDEQTEDGKVNPEAVYLNQSTAIFNKTGKLGGK